MSWIRGIPGLSDSSMMEQLLLCHHCGVVLIVEFMLLDVEVDQFLVQRLIEQLEILQTLDIAVFPAPILSSADVVQRILDSVVAERLPRVVLEDSNHLQELDVLPVKIDITVHSVFDKIAHMLQVRAVEQASAHYTIVRLNISCQKH